MYIRLNRFDIGLKVKTVVLLVVIVIIATLIASFGLGFIMAISGNIQLVGLNSISFDPLITIAYMILFYFLTLFFQPTSRSQFYLFLFTLLLSFIVTFIQGSIFLVVFYFLLRKVNLI